MKIPPFHHFPGCDTSIRCPALCDLNCIHFHRVDVNQNGMMTIIDKGGARLESGGPTGQRGAIVAVYYYCECGCEFVRTQHFHKGAIFTGEVILRINDGDGPVTIDELWRD